MSPEASISSVRVLEADPDLGAGIESGDWQLALGMALAPEFAFECGRGNAPRPERGGFGALILEGLILIRIDAGGRSHIEMLGEGDVVSPWAGTVLS